MPNFAVFFAVRTDLPCQSIHMSLLFKWQCPLWWVSILYFFSVFRDIRMMKSTTLSTDRWDDEQQLPTHTEMSRFAFAPVYVLPGGCLVLTFLAPLLGSRWFFPLLHCCYSHHRNQWFVCSPIFFLRFCPWKGCKYCYPCPSNEIVWTTWDFWLQWCNTIAFLFLSLVH